MEHSLAEFALLLSVAWLAVSSPGTGPRSLPRDPMERAKALHKLVPLIDGHNDLPWQYREKVQRDLSKLDIRQSQPQLHTDIPRLREGGLGGQFWSVYVPATMQGKEAVRATLEQIDVVYQMLQRYPDTMRDALDISQAPVVFSHSAARALCDHPRNVPDDVLKRIVRNDGVVMVTFVPGFISPAVKEHEAKRSTELERVRGLSGATEQSVREAMALDRKSTRLN